MIKEEVRGTENKRSDINYDNKTSRDKEDKR